LTTMDVSGKRGDQMISGRNGSVLGLKEAEEWGGGGETYDVVESPAPGFGTAEGRKREEWAG